MSLKQVGLPDITSLSISGTTIQLMEALSFTADGQHMVVKETVGKESCATAIFCMMCQQKPMY